MSSRLTPEERGRKRWAQLVAMDDTQRKVLDSLRYRDQDHHIKCGAILGFSGLLIAANLVQFSASSGTIAYMPPTSAWFPVIRIAFVGLIASSVLSIVSIAWGPWSYADDPWEALHQFGDVINVRSAIEVGAIWLCVVSSSASLLSLLVTLFSAGPPPIPVDAVLGAPAGT